MKVHKKGDSFCECFDCTFKGSDSYRMMSGHLASVVGDDRAKEKIGSVVTIRYPAQVDKRNTEHKNKLL